MKLEQYNELRNELYTTSQELINEGKLDEAKAQLKEIEDLTNKIDEINVATANLNALKEAPQVVTDLENKSTDIKGDIIEMTKFENALPTNENVYVNAFAKTLLNKELTNQENSVFMEMNNAMTSKDNGVLIPVSVTNEIIGLISEQYPLFADAYKYEVRGTMRLPKHVAITSGDAKFYDEDTETEEEVNAFVDVVLGGKDIAKLVPVSFNLSAMSIPAFIDYLKNELVQRIGALVGTKVYTGNGTTEFEGVLTALAGTDQVLGYDADGVTYANIVAAMAKLPSQYSNGAAIYANSATIWRVLANLVDGQGRPLFMADAMNGGVRVLGYSVKTDGGAPDGTIVIGNPNKGYAINTAQELAVESSRNLKKRQTEFLGYAVMDGAVVAEDAFVVLSPQA